MSIYASSRRELGGEPHHEDPAIRCTDRPSTRARLASDSQPIKSEELVRDVTKAGYECTPLLRRSTKYNLSFLRAAAKSWKNPLQHVFEPRGSRGQTHWESSKF